MELCGSRDFEGLPCRSGSLKQLALRSGSLEHGMLNFPLHLFL